MHMCCICRDRVLYLAIDILCSLMVFIYIRQNKTEYVHVPYYYNLHFGRLITNFISGTYGLITICNMALFVDHRSFKEVYTGLEDVKPAPHLILLRSAANRYSLFSSSPNTTTGGNLTCSHTMCVDQVLQVLYGVL